MIRIARLEAGALDPARALADFAARCGGPDCGALVSFTGQVRGAGGVTALELETYRGATLASIEQACEAVAAAFPLLGLAAVHRHGRIAAGEAVVFVAAAAVHRRDAFAAADCLMDRLKTEAVFWKREILASGDTRWIEPRDADYRDRERWSPQESA